MRKDKKVPSPCTDAEQSRPNTLMIPRSKDIMREPPLTIDHPVCVALADRFLADDPFHKDASIQPTQIAAVFAPFYQPMALQFLYGLCSLVATALIDGGGGVEAPSTTETASTAKRMCLDASAHVDSDDLILVQNLMRDVIFCLRQVRLDATKTEMPSDTIAALFMDMAARVCRVLTPIAERVLLPALQAKNMSMLLTPPAALLEHLGLSEALCKALNIRLLFHTPGCDPKTVVLSNIDMRYSKLGSFGRGCYFASEPRKAMSYFRPEWGVQEDTKFPGKQYMLMTLVALGRPKIYPSMEADQALFREPDGFDSVIGCPRDMPEYVVFNSQRVFVCGVVYYTPTVAVPPPQAVPTGVMIPSALKAFFVELISRGENIQQGMAVRLAIGDLLKSKIAPQHFVDRMSALFQAPSPVDLVENLTLQLQRVRSPSTHSAAKALVAPTPAPAQAPAQVPAQATAQEPKEPAQELEVALAPTQQLPTLTAVTSAKQQQQQQRQYSEAPSRAHTQRATIILPRSLKVYFQEIKSRCPTRLGDIDKAIFDLVAHKITTAEFLTKISVWLHASPPPGLEAQMNEQLQMASFKHSVNESFSS